MRLELGSVQGQGLAVTVVVLSKSSQRPKHNGVCLCAVKKERKDWVTLQHD